MAARVFATLLIACALSGSLIAWAAPRVGGGVANAPRVLDKAPAMAAVRGVRGSAPLAGFDPLVHRREGAMFVADLADGKRAELTLDVGLQEHIGRVLEQYGVPYAAAVAIEPNSGRVLAYVSHSSANPNAGDLARDPSPPAASVFKLVTSAALIETGAALPDTRVCYGGGASRLALSDIEDNPARDSACSTLSDAVAHSTNAVIAKLADRKLNRALLERYAGAFGFGQVLPFDAPTRLSPAEVPDDRLERARTAAGFWHMHMSPLHAALIGATIANGGAMPRATMVERVLDPGGKVIDTREASVFRNVISRATAKTVGGMMLGTVSHGTAHSAFYDPKGLPFLPGIAVAGKTGSLSSERPYRAYSWWVGYAPESAPTIAVAVLIVNTPKWRIKAGYLAREALRYYLVERKAPPATRP